MNTYGRIIIGGIEFPRPRAAARPALVPHMIALTFECPREAWLMFVATPSAREDRRAELEAIGRWEGEGGAPASGCAS